MEKTKKELEDKAQEAVRKAAEAVRVANEALVEAHTALQVMQALSDDDLDQVAGGDGSKWDNVPRENEYPIDPTPINP